MIVEHLEYKGNSVAFLADDGVEEYLAVKPDIFIYEPLLLNSNGISSAVEATNEMIDEVLQKLEEENKYMYTILTRRIRFTGPSITLVKSNT